MYSPEVIEKSILAMDTQQLIDRWERNLFSDESRPIVEAELRRRGINPEEPLPGTEPLPPKTMSNFKESKGVGGWLAFFIIAMCVIGPMLAISNTFMTFQTFESSTPSVVALQSWQEYKQGTWVVLAFSIILRLVAGFMLASKFKPASVRFAIGVLWITPVIAAIGAYNVASVAFSADVASGNSRTIFDMVKGFFIAGIWTTYLLKSVRVKNTYYASGS